MGARLTTMEIIVLKDAQEVGEYAAKKIAAVIEQVDHPVIGVATGSSPLETYEALARRVKEGLDVSDVQAFALDEYVGLPAGHPESYAEVIRRTVTELIGLKPEHVHVPDGRAEDIPAACQAYEDAIIAAGGIDIQLLGIGANGHIGFNEPSSSFASRTRIKTLSPKTRKDNARFFDGDMNAVPLHCLTQGIGTILRSGAALLVATGENKADAIAAMVEGPLSAFCPASALQLHEHATVVIDEAAASKLQYREYYDAARDNRPDWQL